MSRNKRDLIKIFDVINAKRIDRHLSSTSINMIVNKKKNLFRDIYLGTILHSSEPTDLK